MMSMPSVTAAGTPTKGGATTKAIPVVYAVKSRPVVVTPTPPEESQQHEAYSLIDEGKRDEEKTPSKGQQEQSSDITSGDLRQGAEVKKGGGTILSAALNGERRDNFSPPLVPYSSLTPQQKRSLVSPRSENGVGKRRQQNGNYPRPVKRFHSKNIPKPRRSSDASASSIRNPRSASSTPSGQVSGGFNKSLKSNEANQIGKDGKRRNSVPCVAQKSSAPVLSKNWKCPGGVHFNCSESFLTEEELDEHLKTNLTHRACRFVCSKCSREYDDLESLNQHFSEFHKDSKPPAHECKYCVEKTSNIHERGGGDGFSNEEGISSVGGVDVSSSGNTKSCVSRDASASGGGGGGGGTNSLPIKKRGHRHSRPSPSSAESPSVEVQGGEVVQLESPEGEVDDDNGLEMARRNNKAVSSRRTAVSTASSASTGGSRTPRKRNHPKWMDSMVMEFELPAGTKGKVGAVGGNSKGGGGRRSASAVEGATNEKAKRGCSVEGSRRSRTRSVEGAGQGRNKKGVANQGTEKVPMKKRVVPKRKAIAPRRAGRFENLKMPRITRMEEVASNGFKIFRSEDAQNNSENQNQLLLPSGGETRNDVEPNAEIVSKALNDLNKAKSLRNSVNSNATTADVKATNEAEHNEGVTVKNEPSPPTLVKTSAQQDEKPGLESMNTAMPELATLDPNTASSENVDIKPSEKDLADFSTATVAAGASSKPTNKNLSYAQGSSFEIAGEVAPRPTSVTKIPSPVQDVKIKMETNESHPIGVPPPKIFVHSLSQNLLRRVKIKKGKRGVKKPILKCVPTKAKALGTSEAPDRKPDVSNPESMMNGQPATTIGKIKVEQTEDAATGTAPKNSLPSVSTLSNKSKGHGTEAASSSTAASSSVKESKVGQDAPASRLKTSPVDKKKTSEDVSNYSHDIGSMKNPFTGDDEIHFDGMPKLLVQESVTPITSAISVNKVELDDSESNSDNESEYRNVELPRPNNRRQSSKPFIKDAAIRFLCNKVSNRDMLRIRKELIGLKKRGNYFKLTKVAPLSAGLIHDMFCRSLNNQGEPLE